MGQKAAQRGRRPISVERAVGGGFAELRFHFGNISPKQKSRPRRPCTSLARIVRLAVQPMDAYIQEDTQEVNNENDTILCGCVTNIRLTNGEEMAKI